MLYEDFAIEQLAAVQASAAMLRSAGLRTRVCTEYEAETVEVYRPRDPGETLWVVNATVDGMIAFSSPWSGPELTAPSVEAALAGIVEAETTEQPA